MKFYLEKDEISVGKKIHEYLFCVKNRIQKFQSDKNAAIKRSIDKFTFIE